MTKNVDSKKDVVNKYFDLFNDHSIKGMDFIMDCNVRLVDWNIDVSGKESVLTSIHKIFIDVPDIKIEVIRSFFDKNVAICELLINKDLKVVDVLEFNDNNQLKEIRAYKQ